MSFTEQGIPQAKARELLLGAIAGCGREPKSSFVELRFRAGPGAPMRSCFLSCRDLASIGARAAVLGLEHDVFVGCAPRGRRFGGADAIERVWMLWADLDGQEALGRLEAFTPAPSFVIASGSSGCAHAWWVLQKSLSADHARIALRRLAHALGADMAAGEPARILRLPGTTNRKHAPPAPVECTRLELDSYHAREIVGHLADPPQVKPPAPRLPRTRVADGGDPLRTIVASEYVPALTGREPDRDGKLACPFHAGGQERTPSFHVYPDDRGWTCFGACEPLRHDRKHAGGDIYTFAGLLYDLDPQDAEQFKQLRRRLAADLLGHMREAAA